MGKYYGVTFQSTPSARKVTGEDEEDTEALRISIHTFLAEGDGGLAGKGN